LLWLAQGFLAKAADCFETSKDLLMAFIPPKDRVLERSTSNSQSVFTVTGAADSSFNAFSASMAVGDFTTGGVVEAGVAFKSGKLTYTATNEITIDSTGFESKGTFSPGGVKEVFMGLPGSRAPLLDRPASFTDTTDASSSSAGGAFTIAGGLAVAKKLYAGAASFFTGIASFLNATASTSTTTGAVVIAGGLGVGGQVTANNFVGTASPFTLDGSPQVGVNVTAGSSGIIMPVSQYALLFIAEQTSIGATAFVMITNTVATIVSQSNPGQYITGTSPGSVFSIGQDGTNFRIYNGTAASHLFKCLIIRAA
jgi:hypothetical protein